MSLVCKTIDSPVGKLKLVASDDGLVAVLWENDNPRRVRLGESLEDESHPILIATQRQLDEYFAGKRNNFSVPLECEGLAFRRTYGRHCVPSPLGKQEAMASLLSNWAIRALHEQWAQQMEKIPCRLSCLVTG